MTIDELYQHILDTGISASRDGNTITVTASASLDLRSLTTLPEGVTLLSGGNLNLRKLTTLPAGVTLSAGGSLYLMKLTTLSPGVTLSAGGYLDLGNLATLPTGVTLSSRGSLDLRSLTTLSPGVTLTAVGGLELQSLTTLPAGVTISTGGRLDLRSLTTLTAGVTLTAVGGLELQSLTTLPAGVTLSAGGYLDLRSLTTLQEGATLTAGGDLELQSLTTLPESVTLSAIGFCYGNFSGPYRGLTLASYDGIISELVGAAKMVGEYAVQRANYFLASGRSDRGHYIAVRGEHSAHGSTVREAVEDCATKALAVDPSTTIAEIKASGTVTLAQYRAITGACREGCRQWAASNGLDGREEIAVEELRPMLAGVYGSVEFLGAIA